MNVNPRTAFFDSIADKWDGWEDLAALDRKLAAGLEELGLGKSEKVADIGCGTGNLTQALLRELSPQGRVAAVDLSPRMVEQARRKICDERVEWHVADARSLPFAQSAFDRVICFSVWPHLEPREAVATEMMRVLRPGGALHVWHLASREQINRIHASAGEAVRSDLLPPAAETGRLLRAAGFFVSCVVDTQESYLVTAFKPER